MNGNLQVLQKSLLGGEKKKAWPCYQRKAYKDDYFPVYERLRIFDITC